MRVLKKQAGPRAISRNRHNNFFGRAVRENQREHAIEYRFMQPSFVHLRLHSEYSIADGIVRLDEAVTAAAADGMPALALTDLANVFGMVKFYKEARG
jgi:DNA polymerase III alpha subunit (gram-positive type)